MTERGEIRNRKEASRLRSYKSLQFGKITPTDIDGFVEFGDKLFVIIEGKNEGVQLPFGQQLALNRLSLAIHDSGRNSLLIICEHTMNEIGDVDVGLSTVRKFMYNRIWINPEQQCNVRQVIEWFLDN